MMENIAISERRSLRLFDAIPPYLGGKRKLLATIFREIARIHDPSRWPNMRFVDGFMGGGSVAIYAKSQFQTVLANDTADRSAMIAKAVITNDRTKLTREDCLLLLAGADSETNFAQRAAADWFHPDTARFIDRAIAFCAQVSDPVKREMLRLITWRAALGARPSSGDCTSRNLIERAMAGELRISGVMGATFSFRPPDIRDLWRMAQSTNRGIFRGNATFTQSDALEVAPTWNADIVYVDPPYAGTQAYEKFYNVCDSVMAQRALPKDGVSPFTNRATAEAVVRRLIALLAKTNTPLVVWSFSDLVLTRDQQVAMWGEHFHAHEVAIKHRHSIAARAHSAEKSGATEVLIVAKR
jgi:hypothetical protein